MVKSQIIIESVWKFYGETSVLKDISFAFESGNIYLINGENGAGKTSLLSVFAGLANFQEGKISFIKDNVATDYNKLKNAEISSAFPVNSCYNYLTVAENLKFSIPLCPKQEQDRVVEDTMELFDLTEFRNKRFIELSKGFQTRTSLAMAFINRPLWIVLDEPSVHLDSDSVEKLLENINLFNKIGTSFLISSHEKRLVDSISSVNLRIHQGELRHDL